MLNHKRKRKIFLVSTALFLIFYITLTVTLYCNYNGFPIKKSQPFNSKWSIDQGQVYTIFGYKAGYYKVYTFHGVDKVGVRYFVQFGKQSYTFTAFILTILILSVILSIGIIAYKKKATTQAFNPNSE